MEPTSSTSAPFGFAGLFFAAIGLVIAMVTIYAGPFAPQPELGVAIGEVAGDAIKATLREVFNRPQPENVTVQQSWTIDKTLQIIVVVTAVFAILLAIFAAFRREPRTIVFGALSLGIAALVFQFFAWVALLICGVIIIMAILNFFGDVFSF